MLRSRQIQLEGGIKYLDPEFVWDKAHVPARVRPPVAPLLAEAPHTGGNVAESLRPRCACVTAKGTQCTRTPSANALFCKAHATTCKNKIPLSIATATATATSLVKSPFTFSKSPKSPKSVGLGFGFGSSPSSSSRPKSPTRQSPRHSPKSKSKSKSQSSPQLSTSSLHLSFPSRPSASRPSRPTVPFLSSASASRSTSPRALVSTPLAIARPVPTCAAEHAANVALLAANAALRSKAIARIKSLKRVAQATQEQTQRVRQELGACLASAQKARDSSPQVAPVVLLQLASQALARASTVLKALEASVNTLDAWMADIGGAETMSEAESEAVWDGIPRLFCKAAADCIHCAIFVLDRCVQQDRETLQALPKDRVPLVTEPMQIKELELVLLQLCPACTGTYDLTDTKLLERFVHSFFGSRHSAVGLQGYQEFLGSLRATVEAAGRKRGTSQVMLGFSETSPAKNPVFQRVGRMFQQLKDSTSQLIEAANDVDAFEELLQAQVGETRSSV